ncbi:MAG: hypothetical protein JXQ73_23380 [Phycisphaerae bacterium]|nr:hypothetical protein [Phycisphaerae bacterium]
MKSYPCQKCPLHAYADRKPNSIIARIWRWHTGWCPGWKGYQKALAEQASTPSNDVTATGQDARPDDAP